MPDYRLYQRKPDGDLNQPSQDFFATSDDVAIRHAQGQPCPDGGELWEGERFVAAVGPERRSRQQTGTDAPV